MDIRHKERYIERLEAQLVEAHRRLMNDKDTCNPWQDIPAYVMYVTWEKRWQGGQKDLNTSYVEWKSYWERVRKLT